MAAVSYSEALRLAERAGIAAGNKSMIDRGQEEWSSVECEIALFTRNQTMFEIWASASGDAKDKWRWRKP